MLNENLVFIDLETTGGSATRDRIIEIGLCEVNEGQLVREWSTLVNPQRTIPPFVQNHTGITDTMVQDAPLFGEIRDELLDILHDRILVAHNARFDYGFLKNEFRRADIAFKEDVLCTVKLSRRLYPQYRRHNLDAVITRHGLRCDARHRALGDARVLWDFVRTVYRDLPLRTVEEAMGAVLKRPSLPPHLSLEELDGLPEGPGVYCFFGENEAPLYVGKSVNLRSRVWSHFSGDHLTEKDMRLSRKVHRIDWIETAGELGALLLENRLIKERAPLHNRRLRTRGTPCSFRPAPIEGGFLRPEIIGLLSLGKNGWKDLYGAYKSRREAEKVFTGMGAGAGPVRQDPRAGERKRSVFRLSGEKMPGRLCRPGERAATQCPVA